MAKTREHVAKALKGGVTMATTRFRYGDDFTVENYKEIERLPPIRKVRSLPMQ